MWMIASQLDVPTEQHVWMVLTNITVYVKQDSLASCVIKVRKTIAQKGGCGTLQYERHKFVTPRKEWFFRENGTNSTYGKWNIWYIRQFPTFSYDLQQSHTFHSIFIAVPYYHNHLSTCIIKISLRLGPSEVTPTITTVGKTEINSTLVEHKTTEPPTEPETDELKSGVFPFPFLPSSPFNCFN